MGEQQPIEFLDNANGQQTAQRLPDQALVCIDFIDDQFDFPTFVVCAGDLESWGNGWVEEAGEEAMTLAVAFELWVGDGVLHKACQNARSSLALLVITRHQIDQET